MYAEAAAAAATGAAPAAMADPALVGRKRPRSPDVAGSAMDQQRLLSFAHFTAAVRDARRPIAPAPLVLPGISHLLNQSPTRAAAPAPALAADPSAVARQRANAGGDYIERPRAPAPAPASVPSSPVAGLAPSAGHSEGDEDDEDDEAAAEDKTPWPSASEYSAIFANRHASGIPVYDLGVDPRGVPLHPEFIYSEPVSCMYFLKCAQLLGKGSFGFPRKKKSAAADGKGAGKGAGKRDSSKDFEWRKMSFVTGLPKKQPVVRYITATCYSRARDAAAAKKKVFRMHAVMLADAAGAREAGDLVLVHIRAGGSKRVGLRASTAAASTASSPPSPAASPVFVRSSSSMSMGSSQRACGEEGGESRAAARPSSPPTSAPAAASLGRLAAPTSPRRKTLLHADLGHLVRAGGVGGAGAGVFGRLSLPASPLQEMAAAPVARHPLLTLPPLDAAKVSSARQAMRDMILQSCRSRDEVATYVHCLQEELAALQQQTQAPRE